MTIRDWNNPRLKLSNAKAVGERLSRDLIRTLYELDVINGNDCIRYDIYLATRKWGRP